MLGYGADIIARLSYIEIWRDWALGYPCTLWIEQRIGKNKQYGISINFRRLKKTVYETDESLLMWGRPALYRNNPSSGSLQIVLLCCLGSKRRGELSARCSASSGKLDQGCIPSCRKSLHRAAFGIDRSADNVVSFTTVLCISLWSASTPLRHPALHRR